MSRRRNPKFLWLDALTASDLHPSVKMVGTFIGLRWNGGNDLAYASEGFISKGVGMSISTVRRSLATLRREGWLFRVRQGGRRGDEVWISTWRPTFPTGQIDLPNRSPVTSQPVTGEHQVDPLLDPYEVDPYISPGEIPVGGPEGGRALRAERVPEQPALRAENAMGPWATPAPGEELPEMSPAVKNQWANCPAYDSWVPGRVPCPHECAEGGTCVASMMRWQQEMDS